jgi:hypothetical protein
MEEKEEIGCLEELKRPAISISIAIAIAVVLGRHQGSSRIQSKPTSCRFRRSGITAKLLDSAMLLFWLHS